MKDMKKVHFLLDPRVDVVKTYPIYQAFADLLDTLQIRSYFQMNDIGVWREPDYEDQGYLRPHQSIDWLISKAHEKRVNKTYSNLNMANLLTNLRIYSGRKKVDYSVLITDRITVHPTAKETYGRTTKYQCTVLSLNFLSKNNCDPVKSVYNLALHEFGHLFGLILDTSRPELSKQHCLDNDCVMSLYDPYQKQSTQSSYCEMCLQELRQFVDHVKTSTQAKVEVD